MGETDWAGWSPAAFTVLAGNEDGTGQEACTVVGWMKGALALDYRPHDWREWEKLAIETMPWCWALTHVPTGWGMCALCVPASSARAMVDEIAAMTDWSTVTVETAPFLARRMREFFDRHPGQIVNPSQTIGPWAALKETT